MILMKDGEEVTDPEVLRRAEIAQTLIRIEDTKLEELKLKITKKVMGLAIQD